MTSAPQPETTPAYDSQQSLIYGIYDRLVDHGRSIVNVVLAPADADGKPDWEHAYPVNLESLPADEWPEDAMQAARAAVLVDDLDGCDPTTSMLVFLREDGNPNIQQIAGPDVDADIAMRMIGRDIGAAPPERPPAPLAESLAKLTADLFPPKPVAANDNDPTIDKRLLPFGSAYGGEIRGTTLFGANVDGRPGQISFLESGEAWFFTPTTARRVTLPTPSKERFTVDWFGDIEESMPKEEILKGVFGVNEYSLVSGKPGSGKSVIATDMACHVAAGMEWHGRPVRQGLVVYIAAERKALTKRRMLAFRKTHGVGNIPLMVLGGMMDLTSGLQDAQLVAATIRQAEQDCGMSCVWVIVDTLTRTFGPGDQNTSKDMTKFVQACDHIREAVTDTHLTVIHHTGWAGDRGKGAIDLDGAVDATFLVKKEAGGYLLECDGTNDGEEGVITNFRMEGVQVGEDAEGNPTMAPVVVPHDGMSQGERLVAGVKGHAAKALEVLRGLYDEAHAVPQGLWRSAFYSEYKDVEVNILKSRFNRSKDALKRDGFIVESDDGFSIN